ncbi:Aspartic proteinase Asp1-like protein [Drosera capensis]
MAAAAPGAARCFCWWLVVALVGFDIIYCSGSDENGGFGVCRGRKVFFRGVSSSSMNSGLGGGVDLPSSVVFPVYGNVYPLGFYYALVNVGQPPKPYFLDPDTGSDLTWLQCDAPCVRCTEAPHPLYRPGNDLVPCNDSLCAALQPTDYICESPEQCDYEVEYADGGSSYGVLINDIISLNSTNGDRNSCLAFGCGYDQIPGPSFHPLDGVLGLGKGKASIVSQLNDQGLTKNILGHCLSSRGGGNHYSPGPAELIFGRKSTGIKNLLVIFDSGSSYTYFASRPYQALIYLLRKELAGKPLRDAVDDATLPLCWKGKKPFRSITDARKYFKPLAVRFWDKGKAAARFELPPESYLIISLQGNVCLGILNGTEVGLQNFNVIGDISMQDKMVIYDNEKQMIGWAPTSCDRLPKERRASS